MSHEPFFNMRPYHPDGSGLNQTPDGPGHGKSMPGDFSIDALVSNRRRILETKFDVFADLLKKRLKVREKNLDALLEDELMLRTLRHKLPADFLMQEEQNRQGLVPLEQSLLKIEEERRDEERGTWRDLVPVIRDLLTTWEALEQAKARAIFLKSYPNEESSADERGDADE